MTISGILTLKSTKPTHIRQAGDCMRKHYTLLKDINRFNISTSIL